MPKDWVEELMQLMCASNLPQENIRTAQQLKRRNFPESLYKFREVNDYSLSNLRDSTLHLTFASNFNDPYDSAVNFDPHFGKSHIELLLEHTEGIYEEDRQSILCASDPILELVKHDYSQIDAATQIGDEELAKVATVIKDSHANFIAKTITEMNRQIQNSYKICSLTERLDSLPLWAHYAKDHTGFAMRYDFRGLPPENMVGLLLWPVIYSGVFNASNLLRGANSGKAFNNLFGVIAALHKSPDWDYEEEWRLVLPDSKDEPPRNLFAPLKAVYLGSKISESNETLVIREAHAAGIPVFKMRLIPHEFRMEAVPHPL
ncbi:DUF2971 domain-containing protein [Pseudomonas panipatensis]|uniref:DUF2971 domain-containing protein n=1 Tax=Pseudomonas panipatensis TaxID=428992 RepID=A0A1G8CWI6_9PSED|nr:DUF2971 domain-containing protein [Pseudomonas panipatensis]SDH49907.1 Protein of unknown function [Pseudomonas panipatensis]SMP63256.1 Protein of unknown function [Pseudomonas panipatensis]